MLHNPYIEYDRSNLEYARKNRKNPTPAEKKLREEVLRKKQTGWKFTRQKPIWPFIADFYCSALLVVIEVDGEVHDEQEVEDSQRTDRINDQGIVVRRYTNDEVLEEIDYVRHDIVQRLVERHYHIFGEHCVLS